MLEDPREVVQAPSGRYLRSVNDGPRFVVAVVLDLIEHGVREVWRGGGLAVVSRRAGGVRSECISPWVWIAVAPRLRGRDGGGGRFDDGRVCGGSGDLALNAGRPFDLAFVDWLKSSVPCSLDVRSHDPFVERRWISIAKSRECDG